MNSKQLREKRANTWSLMQEIQRTANDDGGRVLNAEEIARWDKLDKELRELTEQIRVAERNEELDGELSEQRDAPVSSAQVSADSPNETERSAAWSAFLRYGREGITPEERTLIGAPINPREMPQLRAQGVATGGAGGYSVPEGFRNQLIEKMKSYGGMLESGEILDTDNGQDIPFPTSDSTGNKGALLAENTQVTEADEVLGQETLKAYMYTSKLVRVSIQLIQDSAFNVDAWLTRKLAERLGRIFNEDLTTGTGAGAKPEGLITGATVGKTGAAGQVSSFTYDDLVDLIHSVDAAYRASGRTKFMLHDLTLASARKLKDSQQRPLWQPSVVVGTPDTLLGYPLTVNNDMPTMAASAKSIAFGDFQAAYVVRRVRDIQLLRLTERYADYLQVGFLAFQRIDGLVQDDTAVKLYAHPAA